MLNEQFYICKRNIYLDIISNKLSYIESENSITLYKKHEKYYRITETHDGIYIGYGDGNKRSDYYLFTINNSENHLTINGSFYPSRYERKIKIIRFLNQTKE